MYKRQHQSGHLVNLSQERFDLVKEAISYSNTIRVDIKNAVPLGPLGLSKYRDPWVSMGLNAGKKDYVAVWRRNSQTAFATIPVEHRDVYKRQEIWSRIDSRNRGNYNAGR